MGEHAKAGILLDPGPLSKGYPMSALPSFPGYALLKVNSRDLLEVYAASSRAYVPIIACKSLGGPPICRLAGLLYCFRQVRVRVGQRQKELLFFVPLPQRLRGV